MRYFFTLFAFACTMTFGDAATAETPPSLASGDFNLDGFVDLAVGVPNEDIGSVADAGAVNVIYGGFSGLSSANNQFLSQDSTGVDDDPETFDLFGYALAAGDFNGDGFDDLAVGVIGEDIAVFQGTVENAGA